jgi:hypothetical protein
MTGWKLFFGKLFMIKGLHRICQILAKFNVLLVGLTHLWRSKPAMIEFDPLFSSGALGIKAGE